MAVFAEGVAHVAFAGFVLFRLRGAVVFAIAAALSTWVVSLLVSSAPEFRARDLKLLRTPGDEFVVSPSWSLDVPQPFGDFDLYCDLILDPGTTVDLVMRRVEPQRRDDGLRLFHGRFDVLRLSTAGAGPALLGRDEALFESRLDRGHDLVPDQPVTVIVRGRGRELHCEVGGKSYPVRHSADAHGGFELLSRGGDAKVLYLQILTRPDPVRLLPVGWSALLAAALAAFGAILTRRPASIGRLLTVSAALPAGAVLGALLVLGHLLPDAVPSDLAVVMTSLAGLPAALLLAAARGRRAWVLRALLGVLAAAVCFEVVVRAEALRLRPFQPAALSAVFGADSGSAPREALVGALRAPGAVFRPLPRAEEGESVEGGKPVVLFLGGDALWEDAGFVERWTARLATEKVARRLPTTPRPVVAGTSWASVRQQVLLAERHLLDTFRPEMVVLGIGDWEGEPAESPRAVAARTAAISATDTDAADTDAVAGAAMLAVDHELGFSQLLGMWSRVRADREEVPPGTPGEVKVAIMRLADACERAGAKLCVVAATGLDLPYLGAVQSACTAKGVPFEAAFDLVGQQDLQPAIDRLAEVLHGWMVTEPAFAESPSQDGERGR